MRKAAFFIEFLKSPGTVGAIWPSSPGLCRTMVTGINIEHARTVVELGPGTGVITEQIVCSAHHQAAIISVELDTVMAAQLQHRFPQITVINESAVDLKRILERQGLESADAVVSGLPWAIFPEQLQLDLLDAIVHNLVPGGFFTTFAYLQGTYLPAGRRFKRYLRQRFASVETSPVIWKNLPPAFVYRCRKAGQL